MHPALSLIFFTTASGLGYGWRGCWGWALLDPLSPWATKNRACSGAGADRRGSDLRPRCISQSAARLACAQPMAFELAVPGKG